MAAHHRALDRARQSGVGPVAGEEQSPRRRCASRRGGWPGRQRERRCFSRIDGGADERRAARAGRTPRHLAAPRAPSVPRWSRARSRRRRSTPATGARRSRRTRPLVEHPLHRAARQADEGSSMTRPVVPEVHGHDRLRAPSRRRRPRAGSRRRPRGAEERAQCRTRHRRDHRARGRDPLAADVDAGHARAVADITRASAPVRTSPPRPSMKARAGSAYISCSGRSGSDDRRGRAIRRRTSRPARARTASRPPRRATDSAPRRASGSHSHSAASRSAARLQPAATR